MKSFKSVVFSAITALLLAVSLSGCLGDEKTASQGGENGSARSDSGDFKLILKPGANSIEMNFSNRADAQRQGEAIRKKLIEQGVEVKRLLVSGHSENWQFLFIRVGVIGSPVELALKKTGMTHFSVKSSFGKDMAQWDESLGNKIQYIG